MLDLEQKRSCVGLLFPDVSGDKGIMHVELHAGRFAYHTGPRLGFYVSI